MSDTSDRTRAPAVHPFRLNLEQQRKRAKDLQRAARSGDPAALLRFRRSGRDPSVHRLSEAQLVVARELGLPNWPRLKAHILAMEQAARSIDGPAPDGDARTLHIRCGSDLREPLKAAGFAGDFLEYSDPFCQGPVIVGEGWLTRRAAFLASAYGGWIEQTEEQTAAKLQQAESGLRAAAGAYVRVVLWMEHDSYDQLVLARCLAEFAAAAPPRLELISVDHYPGGTRFIGLGQLPPEALRLLWHGRRLVSPGQLAAGRSVWGMLRLSDPTRLAAIGRFGLRDLPHMAAAVRRHCQELPWVTDGLSLTERLILQLLSEGPKTVQEIWTALVLEREPLPWLGDLMLRFILESMRRARAPLLTGVFEGDERRWGFERLNITAVGRAVVAGEVDWLSLGPPERWVGGVRIATGLPNWRWDERSGTPIKR